MKTYHVFIASSLSFQKERDLMEKVLTERNNSELNIVVHRHEKNGDNDLAKRRYAGNHKFRDKAM